MSIYILDQIRFHEFIFKKRKIFNSFQDYSGITENLIHSGKKFARRRGKDTGKQSQLREKNTCASLCETFSCV